MKKCKFAFKRINGEKKSVCELHAYRIGFFKTIIGIHVTPEETRIHISTRAGSSAAC